jgi:HPt (histidine-containing phosphotransfer) domain-containing protein
MTAHATAADRAQSLAAGMNDHLTKPIDPDALYTALLTWIAPGERRAAPPAGATRAAASPPGPGAAAIPPLAGIDTVRGLANHMGRPALYHRILLGFRAQFGDTAAALRDALARADLAQAHRLAHSAKSAAATIGADALSAHARTLEDGLRAGQPPAADALAQFDAALAQVLSALAALAADETAAPPPPIDDRGPERATADDILTLLDQVVTLLRRHDAAVEARFAALCARLGPAHRERLAAIRACIDDIEYEHAQPLLAGLRRDLQRSAS